MPVTDVQFIKFLFLSLPIKHYYLIITCDWFLLISFSTFLNFFSDYGSLFLFEKAFLVSRLYLQMLQNDRYFDMKTKQVIYV